MDHDATLWEGASQTLTSAASRGKVSSARYRLSAFTLYVDRGLVRTDGQQVPLVAVNDVDVKQSMTQKARGIGDVHVHIANGHAAETVVLESVKDPKMVRDLLNRTVAAARQYHVEQGRTQTQVHVNSQAPQGASVAETLRELAALRDQGVLTDAEFEAEKTKALRR